MTKKALFATFLLFSLSTNAEPINSAFGISIGQPYKPQGPYDFSLPERGKRKIHKDNYQVTIEELPLSKKVFKITAEKIFFETIESMAMLNPNTSEEAKRKLEYRAHKKCTGELNNLLNHLLTKYSEHRINVDPPKFYDSTTKITVEIEKCSHGTTDRTLRNHASSGYAISYVSEPLAGIWNEEKSALLESDRQRSEQANRDAIIKNF